MSSTEDVIETGHRDIVHDTQFDYYGRFLATCSSDRTIKIWDVVSGQKELKATLTGHEGPVWMISWAHPKFGTVLASCSYDHKAIVWKEGDRGQWDPVHIVSAHTASVNSVAWAPEDVGQMLATAASDGKVLISLCTPGVGWAEPFPLGGVAHPMGATAVAFAPSDPRRPTLLASCGCDNKVCLWTHENGSWARATTFSDHKDWVRDVAFSSNPTATILASCSQDKTVVIRRLDHGGKFTDPWETSVTSFEEPIWRLSWSPCGTMLLATTASSQVVLLKPGKSFTDEWLMTPVSGGNWEPK